MEKISEKEIADRKKGLWFLIIIVIVIIYFISKSSSSSSSSSDTLYTVNTTTYSATSKATFDEMFMYFNDGDEQSINQLMFQGRVQPLPYGTKVNLISSHFSYCIVRREGTTTKLWVVTEHITKD